jgi:hypothetical protein
MHRSPRYFNDVETDTIGWSEDTTTASCWEWGTPMSGACSGAKAFEIGLTNMNKGTAYLYSPEFDFSNVTEATLCFYQKFNSEFPISL